MKIDFESYNLDKNQIEAENNFLMTIFQICNYDISIDSLWKERLKQDCTVNIVPSKISKPSKGNSYFLELMNLRRSIILEGIRVVELSLKTGTLINFMKRKVQEFGFLDLERFNKIIIVQCRILGCSYYKRKKDMYLPFWLHCFVVHTGDGSMDYIWDHGCDYGV